MSIFKSFFIITAPVDTPILNFISKILDLMFCNMLFSIYSTSALLLALPIIANLSPPIRYIEIFLSKLVLLLWLFFLKLNPLFYAQKYR